MRGNELTPWLIRYGYAHGAFPMTMHGGEVEWFQPRRRALFPIEGIRVSRSLRKTLRKGGFEVRFDTAFEQVIRSCFRPEDNWLSEDFVRVYCEIHSQGWAHSCECWLADRLVGGVYGLALGSCFCAESMFHRETDASKIALWAMVDRCRELGFTIFDAQIMNPHLKSLGAFEVTHAQYLHMLSNALLRTTPWSATTG
jgi:leucyl/phenylalanyl-tRNA--protein transferase